MAWPSTCSFVLPRRSLFYSAFLFPARRFVLGQSFQNCPSSKPPRRTQCLVDPEQLVVFRQPLTGECDQVITL